MGTYLTKPITDKESRDFENDSLVCGVSSMQGWRESQEDAHNCLLDFDPDKNSSLFAVYDGHGGSEVALYAADNLPALVKNKQYENNNYEQALITAYLEFDDSLIQPSVADRLTAIREDNDFDDDEEEEDKEEELDGLYEEAELPLEEIINRYKSKIFERLEIIDQNQPGSSKVSPLDNIKPKSTCENDECGSSSSSLVAKDDETKANIANGVDDSKLENNSQTPKSSLSTKINGDTSNDGFKNGSDESSVAGCSNIECGPSSSKEHNGNEKISAIAHLITGDLEDEEDDDDDDDDDDNDDDDNDEDDDNDDDDDEEDILLSSIEDDSDEEKEFKNKMGEDDLAGKDSGCTAVMALLINNILYVANAGDSRCVVSIDGKAHDMSKDHKPEDEEELERICLAGGKVTGDGRVNGGLNLSRALGDHNYKKNKTLPNTEQMITALPDVSVLAIKPGNNNFLVLACDGIWNSLTSQEVVDFISERINNPDIKLSSICEELFDKCLAPDTLSDGTGCDNMTCIIVKLKPNSKYDDVNLTQTIQQKKCTDVEENKSDNVKSKQNLKREHTVGENKSNDDVNLNQDTKRSRTDENLKSGLLEPELVQ